MTDTRNRAGGPRGSTYRAALPSALVLLFIAPLLFVVLSFAAVVLAGGTLAAVFLPIILRRRRRRDVDPDCITLEPNQYTRVETGSHELPPHTNAGS
ncbi:MAG: hypothetical protein ACE5I7_05110 [Candidatus Binatia bacterium]